MDLEIVARLESILNFLDSAERELSSASEEFNFMADDFTLEALPHDIQDLQLVIDATNIIVSNVYKRIQDKIKV